jgi:hypothetical protein
VVLIGLCLLVFGLLVAPESRALTVVDASGQATVKVSGLVFNRRFSTFDCEATVTNASAAPLAATDALILIVTGISKAGVTFDNPDGTTPDGRPYASVLVPSGGLLSGQSVRNIHLRFRNPNRVSFTFGRSVAILAQAYATSDGNSVNFKIYDGSTVLTIPLHNQPVVTSTPDGDVTTFIHEAAHLSGDRTHVGVYTTTFDRKPGDEDTEGLVRGTFRYFDSSGPLWQIDAPSGTDFLLPIDPSQRQLSFDGSRALVISADEGNTDPVIVVYDQSGSALYTSTGAFSGLDQAQISPDGRYLLVLGSVTKDGVFGFLIRVTDLTTNLSTDLPFDIATNGRPVISISSDGRFQISSLGGQVVLP